MQAPVQNDKIAADIFSQSMKIPIVTLTSEELLSLSPEVCMKWKEQVTLKQVLIIGNNILAEPLGNTKIFLTDPYETYLNMLGPGEEPEPFSIAKDSSSIRSIVMDINGKDPIESVVDSGSSIITMAKAVCHKLALSYNPSITIPMQSTNGGIDHSLGLM
jgi:predicted aspartyl protease